MKELVKLRINFLKAEYKVQEISSEMRYKRRFYYLRVLIYAMSSVNPKMYLTNEYKFCINEFMRVDDSVQYTVVGNC